MIDSEGRWSRLDLVRRDLKAGEGEPSLPIVLMEAAVNRVTVRWRTLLVGQAVIEAG